MRTPVFVLDENALRKNFIEFREACEQTLERFEIAYSVKTNSFKSVLETLNAEKAGFEVASLEEIKKILRLNPRFVVFNSQAKTEKELDIAIKNNFLINADSISEIDKISRITKKGPLKIGMRISVKDSKFGIDERKIKEAIEHAKSKNLDVSCLHLHLGTQLSIKEYEEGIKKFAELIQNSKLNLEYIDVGGGFPDAIQLRNLGLKLGAYLEIQKRYLSKFNSTIILEPGRIIVADSMTLLTKVVSIKENFGKNYAILDAGINLLPRITLSTYKFSKLTGKKKETHAKNQEYLLAGPLLFSNDILGKFNGNLEEGDIIKIENVGAYCYNLAWEISYKKPRTILKKSQ
jgi:diaminopimelate decarboxylase